METVFSKEIQAGLEKARQDGLKKSSRLRVCVGDETHSVLRMWKTGFAIEADGPTLRGFVDLFDGSVHLFKSLIVTSSEAEGERHYEFKRTTAIADAPAVDFERSDQRPVGLIESSR